MGQAIPGLSQILGGVLQSVYLPMWSKAFPINSPLLADTSAAYPTQQYFAPPPMTTHKTAPAPCHCGNCPTSRDFDRDILKVKQTALCWLDEQIDRVRERGRCWLSDQHSVTVDACEVVAKSRPPSKYPPPVSDGIPVRYLPMGDALYAYDVMTNEQKDFVGGYHSY